MYRHKDDACCVVRPRKHDPHPHPAHNQMRGDQDQVITVPGGCCVDYTVASSSEVLCSAAAASAPTNDPRIPFQVEWIRDPVTQAGLGGRHQHGPAKHATREKGRGYFVLRIFWKLTACAHKHTGIICGQSLINH